MKELIGLSALALCTHAQAALLVGGDFQEAGVSAIQVFSGVEPAAAAASASFAGANVWNGLEIDRSGTATPSFPNLLDAAGNPSPVAFTVTAGTVRAFEETNNGTPLRESYLFFNKFVTPAIAFQWSGLIPGEAYELYLYAGGNTAGRRTNFLIDTNGDGSLLDESVRSIESLDTDVYIAQVIAGSGGLILGSASADINTTEVNWGGFQLTGVPEPATAALGTAAMLVMVGRRRTQR